MMAPLLAPRERSDRAFEKLYQRHVGDVYRYALVVMRNAADAEDVTQTTFMNAYRAFARGERPHTPQNWLIAIAHNVCRQRFRQLQRRPNETPLDEDVVQAVVEDDTPSAEDIRRALSHLAFNQRAALVMRELEGRSYAEIAEVLDLSTSAVETLIFRARRALREQLEGGLTCTEAEFAISRQLDGRLPRKEKGALRAHLRECEDCARFARSQRAQRSAIRGLALIPVPSSLTSFFHHGSGAAAGAGAATAGAGLATKAALVGASAIVATGVGVEAARKAGLHPFRQQGAKPAAVAESARQEPRATAAQSAPLGRSIPIISPSGHASAAEKPNSNAAEAKSPGHPRGRATARGQLKPKHEAAPRAHKPAVPPGQEKKPVRAKREHQRRNAGPGGSVLRPPKAHPQPPPPAKKKAGATHEPKPKTSTTTTTTTTTETETETTPLAEHARRVR
jgi:RNA polymerase sigma factor (sigma-70 family)